MIRAIREHWKISRSRFYANSGLRKRWPSEKSNRNRMLWREERKWSKKVLLTQQMWEVKKEGKERRTLRINFWERSPSTGNFVKQSLPKARFWSWSHWIQNSRTRIALLSMQFITWEDTEPMRDTSPLKSWQIQDQSIPFIRLIHTSDRKWSIGWSRLHKHSSSMKEFSSWV